MSYKNKSLGDFLDQLDTIDRLPNKLAKIDERLMELEEKSKEDEDLTKSVQDRSYRRNEEIAQLRDIRQTVLQSQSSSSSSSSLQVHPTGLRELELLSSPVSHSVQRPPHSSDQPSFSRPSSSSAFQPYRRSRLDDMLSTTSSSSPSPFHSPDSSYRPLFGSLSASPSSTRPCLGNISPAPLASSPFNTFLYPQPPQGPNPRLHILQDPLPLTLPNPNPHAKIFQQPTGYKSLGDFLDQLDTIDLLPIKLAKIDERLMELEKKSEEDEDLLKSIQDRTYRRNEEIAQLRGIRQSLLQSQSSSSSSLQVHPTGLREVELLPSSVSHSVQRPPHSSDQPSFSRPSSSSAFQPYRRSRLDNMLSTTTSSSSPSSFHPPESSKRPLSGSLSTSPSSTRPRLGNISPAPLPSSSFNPFLYPHPQGPNPRLHILQDPLLLPLPNPNPNPNQHPLPRGPRPRAPGIKWEGRLQEVFDESVASLGGLAMAKAKDIYELMHAEGLTEKQIQNRLQVMKRRRDPADDLN